jgi:hypothetical protein
MVSDLVAFGMGLVGHHLNQVDDNTGAPLRFDSGHAVCHADADSLGTLRVRSLWRKIQRNARRIVDSEA